MKEVSNMTDKKKELLNDKYDKEMYERLSEKVNVKQNKLLRQEIFKDRKRFIDENDFKDFKKVVVLLTSSRGGSSLLHSLLAKHPNIVTLSGEHTTDYRLCNMLYPFTEDDTAMDFTYTQRELFRKRLFAAMGENDSKFKSKYFARHFIYRLPVQYPNIEFDYERIYKRLSRARNKKELKERIMIEYNNFGLNPRYNDKASIDFEISGDVTEPLRYYFVEETPFVFPSIKRKLPENIEEKTLVLKSPVDAHRNDMLRKLLKTKIDFIHFSRNPAASINGLIDGWKLYRGFYSYTVDNLNISGYTENHKMHEKLWCYDMPDGWEKLKSENLINICAYQWKRAHENIIQSHYKNNSNSIMRAKFENIIRDDATRKHEIKKILNFMELEYTGEDFKNKINNMPIVMATKEPRKARWRDRENTILNVIDKLTNTKTLNSRLSMEHMIDMLGYSNRSEWI